jgi:hypothetical protein
MPILTCNQVNSIIIKNTIILNIINNISNDTRSSLYIKVKQ